MSESINTNSTSNPTGSSATHGTAVVTGASAGLGKIYADRLARRGYNLILVARRGDKLEGVAQTLRAEYGVTVATVVADLGKTADLERVAATIADNSSITMLVNNAGTATFGPLANAGKTAVDGMNDVNVTALVRLSHAILPRFKQRDHGVLINIGSVLGFHTLPFSSVYSGSKGYVQSFTRGLQEEVSGTRVVVQLVLPAATATDIWEIAGVPLSQFDPEQVMSPENCVDAALAGLDQGETITLPSVEDSQLFAIYDAARLALFAATRSGKPATRYLKHK